MDIPSMQAFIEGLFYFIVQLFVLCDSLELLAAIAPSD